MNDSHDTPQEDQVAGPEAGDELDVAPEELREPSGDLRRVVDGELDDSMVVDRANDVGTPVDAVDD